MKAGARAGRLVGALPVPASAASLAAFVLLALIFLPALFALLTHFGRPAASALVLFRFRMNRDDLRVMTIGAVAFELERDVTAAAADRDAERIGKRDAKMPSASVEPAVLAAADVEVDFVIGIVVIASFFAIAFRGRPGGRPSAAVMGDLGGTAVMSAASSVVADRGAGSAIRSSRNPS